MLLASILYKCLPPVGLPQLFASLSLHATHPPVEALHSSRSSLPLLSTLLLCTLTLTNACCVCTTPAVMYCPAVQGDAQVQQLLVSQLEAAVDSGSWMVYAEGEEGVRPSKDRAYFASLAEFQQHAQKEYLVRHHKVDGRPQNLIRATFFYFRETTAAGCSATCACRPCTPAGLHAGRSARRPVCTPACTPACHSAGV